MFERISRKAVWANLYFKEEPLQISSVLRFNKHSRVEAQRKYTKHVVSWNYYVTLSFLCLRVLKRFLFSLGKNNAPETGDFVHVR